MYCNGEARHTQEGYGRKFGQYTEGGMSSVAHEGDTTNSGYLTFDPGGISTINCRPTGGQVLEPSRAPGGEPSSDLIQNPTV